jgi:hypothetical protein
VEQADVATSDGEMERIGEVPERAVGNGIRLGGKSELREIEPHVTGRAISWVPGLRSSTTRK